jgi:hypothetical protein
MKSSGIRRTILPGLIAVVFATLVGAQSLVAQTPAASPEASPVAGAPVPDGPIGVQMQWLLDTANAGAGKITIAQINEHFSEGFFVETTMTDVFATLADLQSAGVVYEIDPDSIITTRDLPASNGRFVLVGDDGSLTEVSVQIEGDTGLIEGFTIGSGSDATPVASPAA